VEVVTGGAGGGCDRASGGGERGRGGARPPEQRDHLRKEGGGVSETERMRGKEEEGREDKVVSFCRLDPRNNDSLQINP
jgi:hypothetical protein